MHEAPVDWLEAFTTWFMHSGLPIVQFQALVCFLWHKEDYLVLRSQKLLVCWEFYSKGKWLKVNATTTEISQINRRFPAAPIMFKQKGFNFSAVKSYHYNVVPKAKLNTETTSSNIHNIS